MKSNKLPKTESLIKHTHFSTKDSKWDLTASEMKYIRLRQSFVPDEDKPESEDILNIMYDCYKLGFAKGLLKAQEEGKESNE